MNRFASVILAVVLVCAVGGSMAKGTMAGFLDTEVSTENWMCAGTRILDLSGGPIVVTHAVPSNWYSEEFKLMNSGTLEGLAVLHIPDEDDPDGMWDGVKCIEAGTKLHNDDEYVYNGTASVGGGIPDGYKVQAGVEPVGAGVASSEPELVAEEGGQVGQITVVGLGTDAGADDGPLGWLMSQHVDVKIWFDENGDGVFDDPDELIAHGKLADIACTPIELGVIPPSESFTTVKGKGGGWGSYFTHHVDTAITEIPLIAGKVATAGYVTVWNDADYLYVKYDTAGSGWTITETHVYAGTDPPEKLAPGQFPYKHDPIDPPATYDLYKIPLSEIGAGECDDVYIAAHAVVVSPDGKEETGWAKGEIRKLKIELHLQQVEDPLYPRDYDLDGDVDDDDAQKRWWPTNAFQGDQCIFDMVFNFEQDCSDPEGKK